jgi:hypothetical protein
MQILSPKPSSSSLVANNNLAQTFSNNKIASNKYIAPSFINSTICMSECENMSELAAVILSRTQLKKGNPELALLMLTKFIAQHGESKIILAEVSKIESSLSKDQYIQ